MDDRIDDLCADTTANGGEMIAPDPALAAAAAVGSRARYEELHAASLADPDAYWLDQARSLLQWDVEPTRGLRGGFEHLDYTWFDDGILNATVNCLDRHLTGPRRVKAAIIWEGDNGEERTLTYHELAREVNGFANVLRSKGVSKGDRVAIYLPMVPELAIAVLACARIGAVHSVVFGGFSATALRDRIVDCEAKVLVTADVGFRAGKPVELKAAADAALEECPSITDCVVVKRGQRAVPMAAGRDTWWDDEMAVDGIHAFATPEQMNAEDPLFILYTSGSTGKPKGVLHTTGGYLLYALHTFRTAFDVREEDTFWCTADVGWVTGHSYVIYGPLAAGATTLMFEGVPTYPDPGRFWDVAEKYGVTIFYTAPTAIRALMRMGDEWPAKHDLSNLRILGTVGEPINPEVWRWYRHHVGGDRTPVIDTYWQTETGGFLITPLPGAIPLKPGSATVPFFGVDACVVKEDGTRETSEDGGYLIVRRPWPGMLRSLWGDAGHVRLRETYFARFPGSYFTGDGARTDCDGYFWLMGRVDDVINVSGHRLGTAEVESALVLHHAVSEAAVVGFPHEIKGEGIYAYVLLKSGVEPSPALHKELIAHVRTAIGPIATPDRLQFAADLPKTRSGKIMRRILRKIAAGSRDAGGFGDTSTLTDPRVVDDLIAGAEELG